jgi:hypothetical protein
MRNEMGMVYDGGSDVLRPRVPLAADITRLRCRAVYIAAGIVPLIPSQRLWCIASYVGERYS